MCSRRGGRLGWRRVWSTLDYSAPFIGLVLLGLVLGPGFVRDAFTAPSGWHWFTFGLWVLVIAGLLWACVKRLRHGTGAEGRSVSPLAPESIPAADVEAVVASTADRISAIKALREQHPGLGLKAAADLVDRRAR